MGFCYRILDVTMKKRILGFSVVILSFGGLYLISQIYLQGYYLFNWTAANSYAYIWIIALALICFNKICISISLTIGNITGILLGQFWGDFIRNQNMVKITADMEGWQVHKLTHHPGVEIWLLTICVFVLIGVVGNVFLTKDRK